MAISDYLTGAAPKGTAMPLAGRDNNQVVQDSLAGFLGSNSDYVQNARQRGVEYAATRGGINSSIAAGASERGAIEAVQPLVQAELAMQGQQDDAALNEWATQQNFGRALYGQQVSNSLGMLNLVQQYALEDPALYTPEVTSGYSNFFQQNMRDIMSQYFKDLPGG